ncbi:MAG: UpxY family transcription antiterminator [Nitrosopumilaceae archaeon]|nr:UpxY family transcription antiterminator [Nitrosopumilaceae archaeon]
MNLTDNSAISQKNWYAVYTIVRHEKAVYSSLLDKEIDSYLPIREVINRWKDRNKKVLLPLFPGYVFVNIDLRDKLAVLNTKGVVRILGVNGNPTPVPEQQVNSIKSLLESGLHYNPYNYLVEGKEVEVINGPLCGSRGRILQRRGHYRLILSVDLIQSAVSVEVDIEDVELV